MKIRHKTIGQSPANRRIKTIANANEIRRLGIAYEGRQLDEIAFPLGGIGAGCVSLGGWGQLRDWEIFNRPNKGHISGTTFIVMRAQREGEAPVCRVLQGPPGGSYGVGGHGQLPLFSGLPAFRSCRFIGMYPMARVELSDPKVPLKVAIEGFNPFIPLDDKNSSIPAAILLYEFTNTGRKPVKARVLATLENMVGFPETGLNRNIARDDGTVGGVLMTTAKHAPGTPRYGTMALATPWKKRISTARAFGLGRHTESNWEFWRRFEKDGSPVSVETEFTSGEKETAIGGTVVDISVNPGESVTVPFIITWLNNLSDVSGLWKTYAAAMFEDAWAAAKYVAENLPALEARTRLFAQRLFESTLPPVVKDAVSSQISILKTPTCLRFEDGKFWGWEGCGDKNGCCVGTCMHVWNYAQALPYLFPNLERSVREQQFELDMDDEGRMCFRQPLPPGQKADVQKFHPAADGQLGGVMKVYREWLISGDDNWLRRVWPACRKSLEFAWKYWDADRDGVIEGVQHNTYDNEFWGPNTMIGTFYLGALRAAEEMAGHLGETAQAEKYRRLFESGKAWTDKNLFNGKWFIQIINEKAGQHSAFPSNHLREGEKIPRHQYGKGCLSDQLIGQWYAEILGLGYLLNPEHVRETLKSIFHYNWKRDMAEHATLLRKYAVAGESGLILCTWPEGGEPPYPFWFATEVWCGIEYQVASHMIYEGMIKEGLAITKGVRDRHDGTRRNPWDEFECGHYYSRSMASYALLLALSGFSYSAPEQRIGFDPRLSREKFNCFFSVDGAWGVYSQRKRGRQWQAVITVDEGKLTVREITLARRMPAVNKLTLGGAEILFARSERDGRPCVKLSAAVKITSGKPLELRLGH